MKKIDKKLCQKLGQHITLDGMWLLGGSCDRCGKKASLLRDLINDSKKMKRNDIS